MTARKDVVRVFTSEMVEERARLPNVTTRCPSAAKNIPKHGEATPTVRVANRKVRVVCRKTGTSST